MPSLQSFVYGLIDPRSMLVRYVGKTTVGMKRPKQHREPKYRQARTYCSAWVRSLIRAGFDYEICVLEETSRDLIDNCERWWIAYGRACGWPLTNLTDGGEGVTGRKASLETRAKMTIAAAKRMTPAARLRISVAHKGKIVPPETRARMSAAKTGKTHSESTKAKIRQIKLGTKASVETRAKMSLSQMGNKSWTGKTFSADHREKIRRKHIGRKNTPETIEKMRDSALRREQQKRLARTSSQLSFSL